MTQVVQSWLPDTALAGPRVRGAVSAAVSAWSMRWFLHRRIGVAGWRMRGDTSAVSAWRGARELVAIDESQRGRARMLGWALGMGDDPPAQTPADRLVLDAFLAKITDDLVAELEAIFEAASQAPSPPPGEPVRRTKAAVLVDLADADGAQLVSVALSREALVGLCKAGAPPRRPAQGVLASRRRAAGAAPAAIEAVLGRVRITLRDLHDLAPGDVLMLDTRLDGTVELRTETSGRILARGLHADVDGRTAVTLKV